MPNVRTRRQSALQHCHVLSPHRNAANVRLAPAATARHAHVTHALTTDYDARLYATHSRDGTASVESR
jgi:hypothetical protein